MGSLTGNTAGSMRKMFPEVKQKVMDMHPSFAAFLDSTSTLTALATETARVRAARKRKASSDLR